MYSNVFNVFMANFQPEMVARVAHRVASTARVSQWNIKLLMVRNHPIHCLLLSMTFPCAINAISIWVLRSWNPNFMVKTSLSWFNPIFILKSPMPCLRFRQAQSFHHSPAEVSISAPTFTESTSLVSPLFSSAGYLWRDSQRFFIWLVVELPH